jgi:hypothetical protein
MARQEFMKGIRLQPFSLRTAAALLAILDTHLNTNIFGRLAAELPFAFTPSGRGTI